MGGKGLLSLRHYLIGTVDDDSLTRVVARVGAGKESNDSSMSPSGSPNRFIGLRFTCFAYSSGNFIAHAFAAIYSAPVRTTFT